MDYKYLHEPFLVSAKKYKEKIAVVNDDKNITYQQLDFYSTILALEIKKVSNVHTGNVGVCLDKGWEQIVTVLAILKAGYTYLPISNEYPLERIETILKIADVNVVISDKSFSEFYSPKVSFIDFNDIDFSADNYVGQIANVSHKELAYIIFTSGTTNTPKGVMIEHGAALNTILDINERFNINETDVVLTLSELHFDLSVYDIFGALAVGATIVIPRKKSIKFPQHWQALVVQHGVTIWNSVPAFMSLFLACLKKHNEKLALRLALLSGDWIPLSVPNDIKELIPGCKVISLGGATEASIWSILYEVNDVHKEWSSIPYGKALKNQEVCVFKNNLNTCKIGEIGEICIAGVGLAKGYLNNKILTERAFVHNPLDNKRYYKTGDLGRYLDDGNIEILGRIDFQVKVNGYRVELKEIEYAINQHPCVKEVLINAWSEDRFSKKYLIAYIRFKDGLSICEKELKEYLRNKLPSYMIPQFYFFMEDYPLTSNGKIDRKSLPVPGENVSNYIR